MILYHFTGVENLEDITERGLVPAIGKHTETEVLNLSIPRRLVHVEPLTPCEWSDDGLPIEDRWHV